MGWEYIDISFSRTSLSRILLLFCLGFAAGSFYQHVAMRIVNGKSWIKGRSRCDICGHTLAPRDLIPVVSFLLLRGRCRYCETKLSYRYLLTELLLGFVYVLTYLRFLKIDLNVLCLLNMFGLFLGLSLVDLELCIIPDGFIAAGIVNRFIDPLFWSDLRYCLYKTFGAFLIAGMVYLLTWMMNKINKKENFGGGDIKLIFVIGLYTGFYYGVWVLLGSSLIGLIYIFCTKERRIPFGPFLSVSTMIILLYRGLI